ncbi:MAG: hypothetical protein N4A49_05285 [Marinifilaceae bacterium]|jgi:hypothetical protein|nr:hypothetical protein [Marinifilaceae bacterium]
MNRLFFLILFLNVIIFSSCSKDDDSEYIPTNDDYNYIAYAYKKNQGIVAFISNDGKVWNMNKTNISFNDYKFKRIIYAESKLWALKDYRSNKDCPLLMNSTDGLNWEEVNTNLSTEDKTNKNIYDIFYDKEKKKFILCTEGATEDIGAFLYSDNGTKWSDLLTHNNVGARKSITKLNNNLYISTGNKGKYQRIDNILISSDLINWTKSENPFGDNWNNSIKAGDNILVSRPSILGNSNEKHPQICLSSDGVKWEKTQGTIDYNINYRSSDCLYPGIIELCYGNGIYMALSDNLKGLLRSEDGLNWKSAGKFADKWKETTVSFHNDLFFAGASTYDNNTNSFNSDENVEILYISKDGLKWEPVINSKACSIDYINYLPLRK